MLLCFVKFINPLGCGSPSQSSVGYFFGFYRGFTQYGGSTNNNLTDHTNT
jgi:hypothetical protein